MTSTNPLLDLSSWDNPLGLPPFEQIQPEHYGPALTEAMSVHQAEIAAICSEPAPPDLQNTVVAFDRSGKLLQRISAALNIIGGAHTSPEHQAVEAEWAPRLALHWSQIYLNAAFFQRVQAVMDQGLEAQGDLQNQRLLMRVHEDFVRAGARLQGPDRQRYEELVAEQAELTTRFAQNLVLSMAERPIHIAEEGELAGLPAAMIGAAADRARQAGREGWLFPFNQPTVMAIATLAHDRPLRQRVWQQWRRRGEEEGERDNRPLIGRLLKSRQEQARLLGYANYADYAISANMAGRPDAAHALLWRLWEPARLRAERERAELAALAARRGDVDLDIEEWDWLYYAELLRKERYSLDEGELRQYLGLPAMMEALFEVARGVFQIELRELEDFPRYHPDLRAWELWREGEKVGVFIGDYYARPSKGAGAWMSSFRIQSMTDGTDERPTVINCCNFSPPTPDGVPCLLGLDELRTLFHEFGHALHGLLSKVRYLRLSGTNVTRDFVEFPSQLMEHWAYRPELLRRHARHHATGAPIPEELLARIQALGTFNQGYATAELISCSLADLRLHQLDDLSGFDPSRFEADFLAEIQMPAAIKLRHRLPHFQHLFASDMYAAQYYVYTWAGVLDADGFGAFDEAGDLYATGPASRLLQHVYQAGDTQAPMDAYVAFRGRQPSVEPLLKKRGLDAIGL